MSLLKVNPRSAGMKYYTIGLEFALSILFGWAGGRWLDGQFDSAPIGEVLGFVFGLIAAFRTLFRAAQSMTREAEAETAAEEEAMKATHEQTAAMRKEQSSSESKSDADFKSEISGGIAAPATSVGIATNPKRDRTPDAGEAEAE